MMRMTLGAGAFLLAMLAMPDAHAGIVIYRCTDAFGRLTVQNDVPCPKGTHQRKQVIDTPPPMPAYRPPADATVKSAAVTSSSDVTPPEPAIVPPPAPLLPPPPLFRCHTPDSDSYLSEDGTPSPRCIAQQVVDAEGNPNAGATACEVQHDTCERIPDGEACAAWQQRAREAEATWRFGRPDASTKNQSEYERIQRVLRESTCATPSG
jgi:hypothetical protein